jgi:toxin ParE1/3/4
MGRKRDDLRPEIRSFPVKRFVIFYRVTDWQIEIVRVISGARDLKSIF